MTTRSRHPRRPGSAARRIAAAAVLLATGALTVTFVSSGGRGAASAETSLSDYVRIQDVTPNVQVPKPQQGASTGRFTVDCGTNGNGKFSPDNPVAQPGIKNGAEHLHDFVGNLAITADTPDAALATAGTTCRNGDRSAYFWPVVRIDKAVRANTGATAATPVITCPNVWDRLPAVPAQAMGTVARQLQALDRLTTAATRRVAANGGGIDARLNNSVLAALRVQRAAAIQRIADAIARGGSRPHGLMSLVDCDVSYDGAHAGHTAAAGVANPSVRCPSVRDRLPGVPDAAIAAVNGDLARLDQQISKANERLVTTRGQGDAILGSLKAKRTATLDRIATAIGRRAARPQDLAVLAACTLDNAAPASASPAPSSPAPSSPAPSSPAPSSPAPSSPAPSSPAPSSPAPSSPAPSSPAVLPDPEGPNLELPNNTGGIVRPAAVLIEYRGNPTTKVTPMPKFLRELTGDAKPTSRGPANARATWTCSGFADRLSTKYPICPAGRQVMRIEDFPGCWDGKNIDSANHRSQVAFADPTSGACPAGFVAIPQLRISISYDIPQDVQAKGQFALDSFPEENHNPFSDHNDFINVNSDRQMRAIAACINAGRRCS
jgi:uncharacterized protein DUF1996